MVAFKVVFLCPRQRYRRPRRSRAVIGRRLQARLQVADFDKRWHKTGPVNLLLPMFHPRRSVYVFLRFLCHNAQKYGIRNTDTPAAADTRKPTRTKYPNLPPPDSVGRQSCDDLRPLFLCQIARPPCQPGPARANQCGDVHRQHQYPYQHRTPRHASLSVVPNKAG